MHISRTTSPRARDAMATGHTWRAPRPATLGAARPSVSTRPVSGSRRVRTSSRTRCADQMMLHSDSVAAVEQAILDGVDVINFSIGGGVVPYFGRRGARVSGRVCGGHLRRRRGGQRRSRLRRTVDHRGPWVTTVAASTQKREFDRQLTIVSNGRRVVARGDR